MKHRFRPDLVILEPFNIGTCDQVEGTFEDSQGFFFDLVVLEAQRLTLTNEKKLADVIVRFGEYLLVTPGLLHFARFSDFHEFFSPNLVH